MLDLRAHALPLSDTGGVRVAHPSPQGLHYDAWSLLEDPPEMAPVLYPAPILPLSARATYLQLPPLDRRIGEMARRFAAGAGNDLERARAVERHLRTDFGYTLELPDKELADPLAYFLFTRRKGHCEYFASAMAVMLRSLEIPARMATGFQSGVYNPVSDLWLVRASDAHSWVEAWIRTRLDDLTPRRRIRSSRFRVVDAADTYLTQRRPSGSNGGLICPGRARWPTGWNRCAPHGDQRVRCAAGLRSGWNRYGRMATAFQAATGGCSGGTGGARARRGPLLRLARMRRRVACVRRGQASVADATLLYKRMLHILKRRGYQKPVWFTPAEFAASLPPTELSAAVNEFTATYNALRFGGHAEAAPRLSTLLDRMERV